jgi:hypothetical protein
MCICRRVAPLKDGIQLIPSKKMSVSGLNGILNYSIRNKLSTFNQNYLPIETFLSVAIIRWAQYVFMNTGYSGAIV